MSTRDMTDPKDLSGWTDSISLRVDFSVPVLVKTKSGKKMASGYELKRFVLAHRCGAEDFSGPLFNGDAQKLLEVFSKGITKKLEAEAEGWKVTFKGFSIMRHPCAETPKMEDPRWV